MYDDDEVITPRLKRAKRARSPRPTLGRAMRMYADRLASETRPLDETRELLEIAIPRNTRRAYLTDQRSFDAYRQKQSISDETPSDVTIIMDFIKDRIESGVLANTLYRNISGLIDRYDSVGKAFPLTFGAARRYINAVSKAHVARKGLPPRYVRQVNALVNERLLELIANCDLSTAAGVRDKAILTVGKFGMARRSELAGMQVEDVKFYDNAAQIKLWNTKTSKVSDYERITLYHETDKRLCPVCALKEHIEIQGREAGPVFRAIDRHGNLRDCDSSGQPVRYGISGVAIAQKLKKLTERAGRDPSNVSGHGLRRGGITDARRQNRGIADIMVAARIAYAGTVEHYTDYAIMLGNESRPNFRIAYIVEPIEALL